METGHHRLAAVWFVDISGYTGLAAEDHAGALQLVGYLQKRAREAVDAHRGRVVKFLGDAVLAEFPTSDAALRAAFAIHVAFHADAASAERGNVLLHTGVHIGEVTSGEDGDLYGDGVNVAARLMSMALPGEILVSEDVWRHLRGRPDLRFLPLGERRLKGVGLSMDLFVAATAEGPQGPAVAFSRRRRQRGKSFAYLGLGILIAMTGLGLTEHYGVLPWRPQPGAPSSLPADVASPGDPAEASIAVLPFEQLGGEGDTYFAEGVAEDILTELSRIDGLRVISRRSVDEYKGTDKPLRQIASELGVSTILEGSVRRSGNRIRISAQLVDPETDEQIWAETYDRELTDIFAIQTEIAAKIASALAIQLAPGVASPAGDRNPNLAAYDMYLRGRETLSHAMNFGDMSETRERTDEAVEYFQSALELDSDYALAWSGLAYAYLVRIMYEGPAWGDSALAAAEHSVQLQPQLPEGYIALAHVMVERGEILAAGDPLRRAIALNPNSSEALGLLATVEVEQGRFDVALPWARRAAAVEPTNDSYQELVGYVYLALDDPGQAEPWFHKAIGLDLDDPSPYGFLAFAYTLAGDDDRADEAAARALELGPNSPDVWLTVSAHLMRRERWAEALGQLERWAAQTETPPDGELAKVYLEVGQRAKARILIREAEARARTRIDQAEQSWRPYYRLAQLSALKNDRDATLANLREARARGFRLFRQAELDRVLDGVRGDERIRDEIEEIGRDVETMRENAERAARAAASQQRPSR